MRHTRLVALAAAALACLSSAACGDGGKTAKSGGAEVTYMTAFGTFGREAYAYVAKDKGFFRDAGIDVTIQPGQGTGNNLKLMTAGKADFAPVGALSLAQAIDNRPGLGIVATAALDQHTMASIMTTTKSGIGRPADLAGKSVGGLPNSEVPALTAAYSRAAGFDAGKIKHVAATPTQLPGLLAAGSVDAIGQYVVSQGLIRKAVGGEVTVFPFKQYLPDVYGALLAVRGSLATQDPALAKKFTGALLKGLEYAIDHPEEAGQILHKAVPSQNADQAAAEIRLLAPYDKDGSAAVGAVDAKRVDRMLAQFTKDGLLKRPLKFGDLFAAEGAR
ncbi:ABC transporter substrate-binding protein [Actinomadura graeca]|uniref:ABC transporter substrate-binding protein n=1 Tax=Actinomadura graeca TaxID=2750812 RepID=A0ABX8QYI8_9ACTN|nr:ABC transporter substrate-binding protein [Actinomadura graeca]QXJ23840.1 ABC transporter substrate-binding protein [Actinomadura graeca]